jgi:O-antigen/teichoic acid export membrane protein
VVAVQLSERLWMLSQSISTILLPKLSELSNDEDKRLKITPIIARLTLASTAFLSIVFAVVIYPIIPIVFGVNFIDVYIPLLILLPGIVFTSTSRVLANDLAARGKPELNMYTSIVVVVCNIIGNIVLIPLYGLAGAATATTIAYIINFILKIMMYHYITAAPILSIVIIRNNDLKKLFNFVKIMIRKLIH